MTTTKGATALALVPEPTFDDALEAYRDQELGTPEGEARGTYKIQDERQAHWAARKLKALYGRVAGHDATAHAEIAKINEWRENALKSIQPDIDFFEGILRFYHETQTRAEMAEMERPDWAHVKQKSIKLPDGVKLVGKKDADSWEFDEAVFIPWAQQNLPAAIKPPPPPPPPAIDKAEAKRLLTVTPAKTVVSPEGVVADGVTVTAKHPTYSVKVEG